MKYLLTVSFMLLTSGAFAWQSEWPVLKTYDADHLQRIAMPVGGIGTGTVSLNGRGGLQDWEVMNRPAKGYNPSFEQGRSPFFALNIQREDGSKITRLLEGPIALSDFEGSSGSTRSNHGLPRFAQSTFAAAYPFGQAKLTDPDLPLEVTVKAFNPLVPGNVDDSSLPIAILTYLVKNTSSSAIEVSVAGNMKNFIGHDGKQGEVKENLNTYREEGSVHGIYLESQGVDPASEQWGTMALVALSEGEVTHRTSWLKYHWGSSTLDFWDDFHEDGNLQDRPKTDDNDPMASLAVKSTIGAGEEKEYRFLIAWHFPNRKAWAGGWQEATEATVGNYYTTQFTDAWNVVTSTTPRLDDLESRTIEFVDAFLSSKLPEVVKEAALFNLAHLRTQLVFRIREGLVFGWEGNFENEGACFGSCTHVWNYEQTTPFLFGELAKSMREVEFGYATDDDGLMSFRVHLPLDSAQKWGKAAADGQMGSIMQFYREWQLSGDDNFLKTHWPKVKKSLEFCWIPGGWDANQDGVMEGAQHNTMDVEYYGPNPQMGFWYLGALRAGEVMANYLGDRSFASKCNSLYKQGSEWLDANIFNGEYYEHQIQPPMTAENIAPSLLVGMGAKDFVNPDYQLGNGCLVDQLIGQVMAHICDLGYLADRQNIQKTHEAIMKYNYKENLKEHTNFMRSYALADEAALLMASYPNGRPDNPFPYFTEVMTGFEYTAAIGMLYEGQTENGLKCIGSIRDRYDGRKRSPFNEAEYGNHYARSMIAWGAVLALTDFHYSAVDQKMKLIGEPGNYFWSTGYTYGTALIKATGSDRLVTLRVLGNPLKLKVLELEEFGQVTFKNSHVFYPVRSVDLVIKRGQ